MKINFSYSSMEEFKLIYTEYYPCILKYLMKMVHYKSDLAEELTQETFYQAYISIHRFEEKCQLKTWLCKIAKNVCFKYFKKNPIQISWEEIRENAFSESEAEPAGFMNHSGSYKNPEFIFEKHEQSELLTDIILSLNEKYRDVIVYRIFFDMSYREIGLILGISENSAKVLFFRGKEMLKERMIQDKEE